MGVLGFLLIGFLAGVAAALVTRTERGGCITTVLTGVVGSLIGGLVFDAADASRPGTFLTAFLGAVALLVGLRALGLAKRR